MIGQQKRSLEHSVSPQPTKYQKHYDDSFCETSTRVASVTGEQLHFEERFSGVQSKYAPSSPPATDFDSAGRSEKRVALDLSDQPRKQSVLSEVEQGANCNSCHEFGELSDPAPGLKVCESADRSYTQICRETKVDNHKESRTSSAYLGNHAENRGHSVDLAPADNSEHARLHPAEGISLIHEKRTQREKHVKDTFRQSSSQSGNECGGSCQKDEGPSTGNPIEMGVEGHRAFLECVRKTVESRRPNGSRPLPVFLSGKVINLYLMNEQVKSHGGYLSVTSEGLWGQISQTLGFVPECGPGVKLIYFKYLKGLERETSQSIEAQPNAASLDVAEARIDNLEIGLRLDDDKAEKFSLVGEQFAESEPLLEHSERMTMNVDYSQKTGVSHHVSDHFEDQTEKKVTGKELETGRPHSCHTGGGGPRSQRVQSGPPQFREHISSEGWEGTQAHSTDRQLPKMHLDKNGPGIFKRELEKGDGRNSEESARVVGNLLGRNQQPLINTLTWIKRMALDPGNPHLGEGIEGAGQNEDWVKDCGSEAEKIRGFFWKKKEEIRMSEAHWHQAKQVLTHSHYYEEIPRPDQQSVERFRASRERVAQYGYPGSPGLHRSLHESSHYLQRGSSPQSQSHWSSHRVPRHNSFHSSYTEKAYPEYNFIDRPRKRIPIGPDFQAHVPHQKSVDAGFARIKTRTHGDETQSSDEDDEDSPRWFGKKVWPPPGVKGCFPDVPVGVGRALTCACLDPESMDCVRIHVQEERLRLERELGQAFYIWKFDEMGESVSDHWTKEEERTFRAMVKMNPPSLDKNFWEQLSDAFPGKKMKELVSYYFNVFVLRRRAIQNRLEGRQVDSDDDETELPEFDSDDSEEYESAEELDEDEEEDASEGEDETYVQNYSYGGGGSGKLLEHTGFCDLGGVSLMYCSTNMNTMDVEEGADGESIDICTSGFNLDNQGFRSSKREERESRIDSAHLTSKWSHEQDEDKHLETHVNLVGDDELQEVKTWEDPHWDEAGQDRDGLDEDADVDATFSGKADQRELSPRRNISDPKRASDGDDQRNTLASCERDVWIGAMDSTPRKESDKLLSTNGMIQELFGDESPETNSPS